MFRSIALASVGVIALATAANAADMYIPGSAGPGGYKDAPLVPTWAGFYAGVNGGWGWSANVHDIAVTNAALPLTLTTGGLDASGWLGGIDLGYNWQRGNIVFGIEGDLAVTAIRDHFHDRFLGGGIFLNAEKQLDYVSTIRGRLGYAFDNVLVYGTGGFAYGSVHNRLFVFDKFGSSADLHRDATETGFTVGGGIEYAISPRLSLKAEYQFIDLGSYELSAPVLARSVLNGVVFSSNSIDNEFHTVRFGLNWHMQEPYQPLK